MEGADGHGRENALSHLNKIISGHMAWPTLFSWNVPCPIVSRVTARPALGRKLSRLRPWVQTGFLGVWLAPVGRWLHGIPGCVFHCYSCPLSVLRLSRGRGGKLCRAPAGGWGSRRIY